MLCFNRRVRTTVSLWVIMTRGVWHFLLRVFSIAGGLFRVVFQFFESIEVHIRKSGQKMGWLWRGVSKWVELAKIGKIRNGQKLCFWNNMHFQEKLYIFLSFTYKKLRDNWLKTEGRRAFLILVHRKKNIIARWPKWPKMLFCLTSVEWGHIFPSPISLSFPGWGETPASLRVNK